MITNRIIFYTLCLIINISCVGKKQQKLHIAASSNLQNTIKELVNEFKIEKNIEFEIILGSTGKLTAQIENNAPFDIFLSANKKYTNYLITKKKLNETPITFAYGKLALASKTINKDQLNNSLRANRFSKLAIPNPKFAPYGQMAMEYLKKKELYNIIEKKLVFGESVMQTNQFLFTANVDLAFTSLSAVIHHKNVNWVALNEKLYTPKAHVALNVSKDKKELSAEFISFLKTETAQLILKKYGYGIIK